MLVTILLVTYNTSKYTIYFKMKRVPIRMIG